MTLSFSTQWPKHMGGGPTNFVEKIWEGLEITENEYDTWLGEDGIIDREMGGNFNLGYPNEWRPKLHTFREDPHDRWKVGSLIHPVIHNRTPNRFQFAPTLVCTTVQKIEIKHHVGHSQLDIDGECYGEIFHHGLDDIYEFTNDLVVLSHNDGFDSIEHFFQWFNEPFVGKLIHWTDLKY